MNDPDILKGVGGCFGLAGIVTAITFKMDETMYPNCNPKKTLTMADPESEAFKQIVGVRTTMYSSSGSQIMEMKVDTGRTVGRRLNLHGCDHGWY